MKSSPAQQRVPSRYGATALACIALCTVLLPGLSWAGTDASPHPGAMPAFAPNRDLEFRIPKSRSAVQIDGRLDEAMWDEAARLSNFSEISPGDNVAPGVATETFLAYDDKNLYVGFRCHDPDPASIRATITDRDRIFQDDYAGVVFDTFDDTQNAYEFFVNPYGVQADLRRVRNNEDSSYDTVWRSAGRIGPDGWTAEIAIPFRSIRFPAGRNQQWGVHVFRIRPRSSRETLSWAPVSRDENCLGCQAGKMQGLEGIHQSRNIELLPYSLGSQSSFLDGDNADSFSWNNDDPAGDAGIGLKYGITSNYTLDFTYNPDFSQIESDATQIDANQTFALFFPERRPFFQEGADLFRTKVNAVYTRSINDPRVAAKVTGKSGSTAFGYLIGYDEKSPYIVPFEERSEFARGGKSISNILRFKRDILTDSFVGVLLTDRRLSSQSGSNTTFGVDTRLRLGENYGFEGQIQGSRTVEPDDASLSADFDSTGFGSGSKKTSLFDGETFGGIATELSVNRNARHYNFWAWYEDFSPTFRAENGFVTSNDYRIAGMWNGYMLYFDDHRILERAQPQLSFGQKYNHDNLFKDEWFEPSIWVRFKKQTSFWTSLLLSSERFAGVHVRGIRRWQGNANTQFSQLATGGVFWRTGQSLVRDRDQPRLGNERTLSAWTNLKPTSQLEANVSVNAFRLRELNTDEEIFSQVVTRTRFTYQFSRRLFLRVIGEYIDWSKTLTVDPLISYKVNPFTVFFAGSSHSITNFDNDPTTLSDESGYRQTDRVFFVKFQYLLRV